MRRLVWLAFAGLFAASDSYAKDPNWVKLVEITEIDNPKTMYVDTNNVRREDKVVKFWLLIDFKRAGPSGAISIKAYERFDCEASQKQELSLYAYAVSMGGGPYIDHPTPSPSPLEPIVPGSPDDRVKEFVCSKF